MWFDLHNASGIWFFVPLAFLSISGTVIGFDEWSTPLLYRLTDTAPLAVYGQPRLPRASPTAGRPITPDDAAAIARAALPGVSIIAVNVPGQGSLYSISARYPEDLTPGGRSRIYIDPSTGRVVLAEGSRTAPAGTRLITLNRAIHTGDIYGLSTKILMAISSLAVVLQLVSGIVLWLTRRRTARRSAPYI